MTTTGTNEEIKAQKQVNLMKAFDQPQKNVSRYVSKILRFPKAGLESINQFFLRKNLNLKLTIENHGKV